MNWGDDATKYTTAAGHSGNILNTFLKEHAESMAWVEEQIDAVLADDENYGGICFAMSGYVTSPSFSLTGNHLGTELYCVAAETPIDIDDPDWEGVVERFVENWRAFEEEGGVEAWNKFYEEGERCGWD